MAIDTYEKAEEVWLDRFKGVYIRETCARFDVDPRRVYEVFEEEKFAGSRRTAWTKFVQQNPRYAASAIPEPHVKRQRVVPRHPSQLDWLD